MSSNADGASATAPVADLRAMDEIVAAIESVLGDSHRPVHLHEPRFGEAERQRVVDCVESGWVSYAGKYVDEFEAKVASFVGAKRAVAMVNGTAALHAALVLNGVVHGDEILVPAITFVATANAVVHAGAVPHFVDVAASNLGMDVGKLADYLDRIAVRGGDGRSINRTTGRTIRAMLPVHVFGHPVDLDPLIVLAARWGILVIEDATESLGSLYKDRACGTFGVCSVLSFNGNKIVTTGGGGMIVTDDEDFAARARHVTTTAKRPHAWNFDHDEVGFNYRLTNLNAALGVGQMERLEGYLAAKRRLAARYEAALSLPSGRLLAEPAGSRSNYWLNNFVLSPEMARHRDAILAELHKRRILARPLWTPMHLLPMYRSAPRDAVPVAEDMFARCISLPSSPFLA